MRGSCGTPGGDVRCFAWPSEESLMQVALSRVGGVMLPPGAKRPVAIDGVSDAVCGNRWEPEA